MRFQSPKTVPTHHSTGFVIEVPVISWQLKPASQQASHSHGDDTSEVSNDGRIAARITMLENKQDEMDKWLRDLDQRLKQLGG